MNFPLIFGCLALRFITVKHELLDKHIASAQAFLNIFGILIFHYHLLIQVERIGKIIFFVSSLLYVTYNITGTQRLCSYKTYVILTNEFRNVISHK